MFVTKAAIQRGHCQTDLCRKGTKLHRKRLKSETMDRAKEVKFSILNQYIEHVEEFTYLGRKLSSNDNDWPALQQNVTKARGRWAQVAKVLTAEGAPPKACAMFYKAIVQTVLLFGSETWVITNQMMEKLRGFHYRVASQICRKRPRQLSDGTWVYPSTKEVLTHCGLFPMEEYVKRRQQY